MKWRVGVCQGTKCDIIWHPCWKGNCRLADVIRRWYPNKLGTHNELDERSVNIPCLHHRAKQMKLDMDNANGNRSGSKLSAGVTASSNKVLLQGYDTHKNLHMRFQITMIFHLISACNFLSRNQLITWETMCETTVIYEKILDHSAWFLYVTRSAKTGLTHT